MLKTKFKSRICNLQHLDDNWINMIPEGKVNPSRYKLTEVIPTNNKDPNTAVSIFFINKVYQWA